MSVKNLHYNGVSLKFSRDKKMYINVDTFYRRLIVSRFEDDVAVQKIITANFPTASVEYVIRNQRFESGVLVFFAACFYGHYETVKKILDAIDLNNQYIWVFFGGLKMACYGKQFHIIKHLSRSEYKSYLTDSVSRQMFYVGLTRFFNDAIVRRYVGSKEITGTVFNSSFTSSIVFQEMRAIIPFDLEEMKKINGEIPNWVELYKNIGRIIDV